MEILEHIALFFHLVGFASLFGVSAVQIHTKSPRIVKNGMLHGALTQFISGPILFALERKEIDGVAAMTKFGIVLVILSILFYYRYRKDGSREIPPLPFFVIFTLTLLEVVIAITWLHIGDH